MLIKKKKAVGRICESILHIFVRMGVNTRTQRLLNSTHQQTDPHSNVRSCFPDHMFVCENHVLLVLFFVFVNSVVNAQLMHQ